MNALKILSASISWRQSNYSAPFLTVSKLFLLSLLSWETNYSRKEDVKSDNKGKENLVEETWTYRKWQLLLTDSACKINTFLKKKLPFFPENMPTSIKGKELWFRWNFCRPSLKQIMNIWLELITLIFELTATTRRNPFETLQAVETAAVTTSACLYLIS